MRGEGGLRAYQLILNLERTGSTRAVPTRGSWSGQRCESCVPENWVFPRLLNTAFHCALSLLTHWGTLHSS